MPHASADDRQNGGRRATALIGIVLLTLLLAGCGIVRLDAPPADMTERLPVVGLDNGRFWPDASPEGLVREIGLAAAREAALSKGRQRGPANFLALSGGSDSGAFGAGLLVGWSASGLRPEFNVVTGISAGALIAPLAFLGPDYDPQLREVFTAVSQSDVLLFRRRITALLFGEALADTSPLAGLINRVVDENMLAAIAREYGRGRLLFIATTNLDLQRPVVWNIGAIAASGHPRALDLFRSILLASASIPGAFPPVLVDVELNGAHYQEMHVDGGATAQVFLYPPSLDLRNAPPRQRTAYVIRNGRVDVEWSRTDRRLLSIAGRSLAALVHFSGLNDISRIYLLSLRDRLAFRLAFIGPDFDAERPAPFDRGYMNALFEYGYRQGRDGGRWHDRPPGVGLHITASRR
jgi:hypothetical protein